MIRAPRVHYGATPIPAAGELCLGGRVKLQRLQPWFPEAGPDADLLYLVSSALPERWLHAYHSARSRGARVVWNQSAVSYPAVWPELACDDDNLLLEQGLHAADYVIYQSEFSRCVADRYLGPFAGPAEVLHNAVDTRVFAPSHAQRDSRSPATLLLGGTQYRLSSLEVAISALAALRRRMPDAQLLVAGPLCWVPDPAEAMAAAQSLARACGVAHAVHFLGSYTQRDAPQLYARADVLLHTRYDDLCPNVVLEAMACGVPVVYGLNGGTPELVGSDAGIGIETGHDWDEECRAEPEAWADAIECVLAERARYGEAARQRAVDCFDLAPWIARHDAIFEQVLSGAPAERPQRTPISPALHEPLRLLDTAPRRVRQGEPFNPQPDGRSAIAVRAANATHATLLVLDGVALDTDFSDAGTLSAALSAELTPGVHALRLDEPLRSSNELDFVVDAASPDRPPLPHALVSVVITCYNHGRFLAEAIESALAQSHDRVEVIVIDDGSTDDTHAVAARYPVRYVHQRNAGLSAARNRGLAGSAGEYVVFLDADDRLLPEAIAAGLECFGGNPDAGLVYGSFRHIAVDGSPLGAPPPVPEDPDLHRALLRYNHIGMHAAVMYPRAVFDVVGLFDARVAPVADYDMYLRIARRFPVHRHDRVVAEYRKYGASMSDDAARMLAAITAMFARELKDAGTDETRRAALLEGLRGNREHYLQRLRLQAFEPATPNGTWHRMLRQRAMLLRHDPLSLFKAAAPRLHPRFARWTDRWRNAALRVRRPAARGARITASPNPVTSSGADWHGPVATTLEWRAPGAAALEVRVHRPDGPLFSASGPTGSAETGGWVLDGTRFWLQDVSGGGAGRPLAVVTVSVTPRPRSRTENTTAPRRPDVAGSPSLLIISLHFGSWPEWLPLYLETCRANPTVDWLIFTDCPLPDGLPPNVKVRAASLAEITQRSAAALGFDVRIDFPYKLCDLRLAFARIFADVIAPYDFFGWSDIDVIYGDIRRNIAAEAFGHDVIAFYDEHLSGHFTLVRNVPAARDLHLQVPGWEERVRSPAYQHLDEPAPELIRSRFSVWARQSYNTPFSPYAPWRDGTFDFPREWYWQNGRLTNDIDGDTEFLYLHFMHWKGGDWARECGNAQWEKLDRLVHFDPADAAGGFRVNERGFFALKPDGRG